ncbi:DUF397 domain-containing protein [Nocardia macrotermitis]|uniref:DUF397 domain-containing protein n=1 Tax=Nocardia macrotermitis TaxID=2585198 RepID=A0A7K0D2W4_9NOCA|nr:DUF397 domain-containing protein [Nocardia macrotermitis]MQY20073.1 hypothetical protein [Nocardia macrotermitis]
MSTWRKSSYSTGSDHCVEVKFADDTVYIRDSKYLRNPANTPANQPILAVPAADWDNFLQLATNRPPHK